MSAATVLELALPAACFIVLIALCWIDPAGHRAAAARDLAGGAR